MGRRQQAADRAIRPKLRSPGHPKFQRSVEVAFWRAIAQGLLPEEASAVAGVAQAVAILVFAALFAGEALAIGAVDFDALAVILDR